MIQSVWVSLPFGAALSAIFVKEISSEARVVSMAFLKNYAFFVLILFPCSLHVVHALNYAVFNSPDGNFMLHWAYSNNKLVFNMTCKAAGWCAVGFTTNPGGGGMVSYDIAAGGFNSASNSSYLEVSLYIATVLFCSKVLNISKLIVLPGC